MLLIRRERNAERYPLQEVTPPKLDMTMKNSRVEAVERFKSRHEAILTIQGRTKQSFRKSGTQGCGQSERRRRGGLTTKGKYLYTEELA